MKKCIGLVSLFFMLITFSCKKKNSDGNVSPIAQQPFPPTTNSDWSFTERNDDGGLWVGAGCRVKAYLVRRTKSGAIRYSGNKFRYFPEGTISRLEMIDSLTGSPSTTYVTFQYQGEIRQSFRYYAPASSPDTVMPIVTTLSYVSNNLTGARRHVKVKTKIGNGMFEGYFIEDRDYTYNGAWFTYVISPSQSGVYSENGFTRPYEAEGRQRSFLIDLENNELSKPTQLREYSKGGSGNVFVRGATHSFYPNGEVNEIFMVNNDAGTDLTIIKKFYWDETQSLNKEVKNFLSLEKPFSEVYKFYPEEMKWQLSDSVHYVPARVEEFSNGSLFNTITYIPEFDIDGKLVKLIGTHTNGDKEEHLFEYTCNDAL